MNGKPTNTGRESRSSRWHTKDLKMVWDTNWVLWEGNVLILWKAAQDPVRRKHHLATISNSTHLLAQNSGGGRHMEEDFGKGGEMWLQKAFTSVISRRKTWCPKQWRTSVMAPALLNQCQLLQLFQRYSLVHHRQLPDFPAVPVTKDEGECGLNNPLPSICTVGFYCFQRLCVFQLRQW